MGTRHLINVKIDGQLKVAQYGQWDGYPTGQGETIAKFLHTEMDEPLFRERLKALRWSTEEDELELEEKRLKEFPEEVGQREWLTQASAEWMKKNYPQISRDTAAGILSLIQSGTVTNVIDSRDFEDDALFCEYVYLIDMDERVVYCNGVKLPFAEFTVERMESLEQELRGAN